MIFFFLGDDLFGEKGVSGELMGVLGAVAGVLGAEAGAFSNSEVLPGCCAPALYEKTNSSKLTTAPVCSHQFLISFLERNFLPSGLWGREKDKNRIVTSQWRPIEIF